MKAIIRSIFLIFSASLLLISCAKDVNEDIDAMEKASLEAWIAKYVPDAVKDGDIYYKLTPTADLSAPAVKEGDYVKVKMVGRTLEYNVFFNTSDSMMAKDFNTFTRKTHYVAKQGLVSYNTSNFTKGQVQMLLKMRQGDSCRVYLPSRLAYGSLGTTSSTSGSGVLINNGYQGNVDLGGNKLTMYDIKIEEVIKDISSYYESQLQDYALANGYDLLIDSIDNFYYKTISIDPVVDQINAGQPLGDTPSFNFFFTTRFLDNFLIATNISSVALEVWDEDITGMPLYYDNSSSDNILKALKTAVSSKKLVYGQTIKLLFPSKYGYGSTGYPTGSETTLTYPTPVIEPYTPLTYEVYIRTDSIKTIPSRLR